MNNVAIKYMTDQNGNKFSPVVSTDSIFQADGNGLQNYILNIVYPIGSIYISVSNVNPSTFIGGTWISFGSGRTMVGVDTNDTNFKTVEKTGGASIVTLTTDQIPSHSHTLTMNAHGHQYDKVNTPTGSTSLSTNQMPKHSHTFTGNALSTHSHKIAAYATMKEDASSNYGLPADALAFSKRVMVATSASGGDTSASVSAGTPSGTISEAGGNLGHSHTLSYTGTEVTMTTDTGTIGETGGGKSHSNLQPYITTYMWKRTG